MVYQPYALKCTKGREEWTSTEEAGAAMQGTLSAAWAMYSERSMSPRVSDNVGGPLPSEQCLQLYQAELVAHFAQISCMRPTFSGNLRSRPLQVWLDKIHKNINNVILV